MHILLTGAVSLFHQVFDTKKDRITSYSVFLFPYDVQAKGYVQAKEYAQPQVITVSTPLIDFTLDPLHQMANGFLGVLTQWRRLHLQ